MTSQPDYKLALEKSIPPQQAIFDEALVRALKATLNLNPCLHRQRSMRNIKEAA